MIDCAPVPKFDHLLSLTDRRGTFEHAYLDQSRPEFGYCTDDMARVLVVAVREPAAKPEMNRLAGIALRFLSDAQALDGGCRNRMERDGTWSDGPSLDDCWGRCLWGLGTAAARSRVAWARQSAVIQFERPAQWHPVSTRATAFAVLGAAELLAVYPGHSAARALISDYIAALAAPRTDPGWPWPEERLTYANAVVVEAMIAAAVVQGDGALLQRGLHLLAWLIDIETIDGHLSPTPVGGRGPADNGPGFDQQPIEASTLANACARAAAADSDPMWSRAVRSAAGWFLGDNDVGEPVWDPLTGAGYDGLHADRVNLNRGAESTLAVISTFQHARRWWTARR